LNPKGLIVEGEALDEKAWAHKHGIQLRLLFDAQFIHAASFQHPSFVYMLLAGSRSQGMQHTQPSTSEAFQIFLGPVRSWTFVFSADNVGEERNLCQFLPSVSPS
jgi:hypothetical protein